MSRLELDPPFPTGVVLAVVIFMTAEASGGVVNPAVATALLVAGEIPVIKWGLYVLAECSGAVLGAVIAGMIDVRCLSRPESGPLSAELSCLRAWTNENSGPGCVPNSDSSRLAAIWMWEMVGTFVLVSTVFAAAVAKPGFGNVAPLAIGASIYVNVGASGSTTGGCYNPARFIGPAVAFGCRINLIALYWSAELAGGILAALSHKFVLRSQMDAITSQVLVSATSQPAPANEDQTRKLAVHDSAAEVHSL